MIGGNLLYCHLKQKVAIYSLYRQEVGKQRLSPHLEPWKFNQDLLKLDRTQNVGMKWGA